MKAIRIQYLLLVIFSLFLVSCDEDSFTKLSSDATIEPVASETDVVLTEELEGTDVLEISWPEPEYGFSASPTYIIHLDKEGGDFSSGVIVNVGGDLSKIFESQELNSLLINLEFEPEVPGVLDIKVESKLGTSFSIFSEVISLNATAYTAFLDLSTPWGVVGGAYNNWGKGPDAPFFTTSTPGVLVCYVKLRAGQIKFRQNNDWTVNVGDNGADGTLEPGGSDITVTAGTKKITFNTNNNTYTIENYSWGLVGSAWNNWGNPQGTPETSVVPDLEFYYDDASDTWRAVGQLQAGQFKIRKNNDWTTNYGDTGADGTLELGGTDITVSAGKYIIIFDLNNLTLVMEPIDRVWGLVGSAYNNWGQDVAPANGVQDMLDAQFVRDWRTDNVWMLTNIVLLDGAFKIRDANNWTLNYGDTGANGSLEENGTDISVTAGLYSIKIDFTNAASPTIVVTRWPD